MEGNRIEDFDLDVLAQRFTTAERRAFIDGRREDALDLLLAAHLVCILRGDFQDSRAEPRMFRFALLADRDSQGSAL